MLLLTYQTLKKKRKQVYIHLVQGIWALQNFEEFWLCV